MTIASADRSTYLGVLAGVVLAALVGCNTPPDIRRTNFEIRGKEGVAKYDPKTGRLQKLDFDSNKNGRMDGFSYMDGTRVIRIEMDQDEDGKIDKWEYYDAQNKIERVGSSSRDDEVQDTWAYPNSAGFLARVEFDTNRDGAIDKREFYVPTKDGSQRHLLSTVEFEIDASGRAGRRLYYRPDGSFEKSEILR